MRTTEYIYMTFIVSIDIEFIMSIDTNIDIKKTYTKVIVSIDIKIIMSMHIMTASLSTTQLAVLGGEGKELAGDIADASK